MTMLGSFAAETGAFLIYSSNACNFRISGRFAQHCWNYYPPFARISRSAENPREIASRSGRRIIFARIMPVTTVPANPRLQARCSPVWREQGGNFFCQVLIFPRRRRETIDKVLPSTFRWPGSLPEGPAPQPLPQLADDDG